MKKLFLIAVTIQISCLAFAQRHINKSNSPKLNTTALQYYNNIGLYEKTTNFGDTSFLSHITSTDTLTIYNVGSNDSGYATGTNAYNDKGFAERYGFTGSDSSWAIIGVYALFAGNINSGSTDSITFKIWDCTPKQLVASHVYNNGFPGSVIDSCTVSVTQLGIVPTGGVFKKFMFPQPTYSLSVPFYTGYTINYNFETLNGDTIGLQCSKNGERHTPKYLINSVISGTDTIIDTIINVQNATLWADNHWHDNYTDNDSLFNGLAIYPILVSHNPNGLNGIVKNNFIFYGCYPNPATINTNFRFSLLKNEDIEISIFNSNGQLAGKIVNTNLDAGEHKINLNTGNYPAGDYYYFIKTSMNETFAGSFSVLK